MERHRRVPRAPAPGLQAHEQILQVRSSSFGVEQEDRKVLAVEQFVTEPARVTVSAGITQSTGVKFEFLRLDVSISVPCYVNEVDDVFVRLEAAVADKLAETIENYQAESK